MMMRKSLPPWRAAVSTASFLTDVSFKREKGLMRETRKREWSVRERNRSWSGKMRDGGDRERGKEV